MKPFGLLTVSHGLQKAVDSSLLMNSKWQGTWPVVRKQIINNAIVGSNNNIVSQTENDCGLSQQEHTKVTTAFISCPRERLSRVTKKDYLAS